MINYSIIIPHKNIPDLLQRCLDSIPRRDDVQIIVVDDNSDDNKVDFTNFPGLNDPYVEVVFGKNENGRKGAGYARNLGLERAKGKWLVFADADDFFMPCFNEVLDKYVSDNNDIIYFFLNSVYSDTLEKANRVDYLNNILNEAIGKNTIDFKYKIGSPVGKLIKRKIATDNNIWFKELQTANDVFFITLCNHFSQKISISEYNLYCATHRRGSLQEGDNFFKHKEYCMNNLRNYISLKEYLLENVIKTLPALNYRNMFRTNKLLALIYLPKFVFTLGKRTALELTFEHDYPKLKKYWLWKILK